MKKITVPGAGFPKAQTEDAPAYRVERTATDDDAIVAKALEILEGRMRRNPITLDSPSTVRDYLRLKLGELEYETFGCVWLDAQNRIIDHGEQFRGTLTQTSVYPREVVKAAMANNAAAVIFYHNHPSGVGEPSHADQLLTETLKKALALVDVRVLDHFIVAGASTPVSFAERGLL